ncbi:Putative nuclease HARBI1-like Protein [Tribolium castaneum]|uniref:Nuclease HARBI1-like Protein n=1 Tax=Tribolium castaneum TaxID=7070 RepID=A0A139WDR7_TRICA|nr:Putative nuclease HARBI1-like Protein [Tribolium castaneum]
MEEFINYMAIRNLEEAEEMYRPNRQRFPRNPMLELSETQFIKMFRLSNELFNYVVDRLEPYIRLQRRNSDLSTETKVLIALNFFATGSYQTNVGVNKYIDVCQSSVSVCIKEVVNAVTQQDIYNEWVHFSDTFEALRKTRQGFFEKHGFPGVVGCIDCTHVANDNNQEHLYINRKFYHSINVQLICDSDLKILNVNARFPDAYIWNQSAVQDVMRVMHTAGENDCFLLGDSGYPLRTWLLTPFAQVVDQSPEAHYNTIHKNTRVKIECCNGVLPISLSSQTSSPSLYP